MTVRVMSFNVCGLPSSLDPLAARAARFCPYIDASGIDVVALQEVWSRRALATIGRGLPSYRYLAWHRGWAGQPAGGLVTFSRRPLTAVSYQSFRGTRSPVGSVGFRTLRAVNSMLQGVLLVDLAGTVIANTHLSSNRDGDWSAGNRHCEFQQAQLIRLHGALRQARGPATELMIAMGDFNIASDGPLYPLVVDGGAWRDPFAAGDEPTYHVELLPPGATGHRIDYLLVAGDPARHPVTAERLFSDPVGGRFLSDHVALAATIG